MILDSIVLISTTYNDHSQSLRVETGFFPAGLSKVPGLFQVCGAFSRSWYIGKITLYLKVTIFSDY